ncbi:hypothetical protein D3C87_1174390 [compost metagenome]
MADAGVRAGDDKQVGKVRQAGAEVGARILGPDVSQLRAVFAGDRVGNHPVGGVITGRPDDQVEIDMLAVLHDDAGFVDRGDPLFTAVQRHVAAGQRGVQRAGKDYPFAADGVIRRQLFPKFGVWHLAFEKAQGLMLDHAHGRLRVFEGNHPGFELPVDHPAQQLVGRFEPKQPTLETAERAVRPRQHPMRRALEHMQVRDVRGDCRNHLGRTGATADDGYAFFPVIVGMVPMVGVKGFALKAFLTFEVRHYRLAQRTCGIDQELCVERAFASRVHGPAFADVVPFDTLDIGLEFHPVA